MKKQKSITPPPSEIKAIWDELRDLTLRVKQLEAKDRLRTDRKIGPDCSTSPHDSYGGR